MPPDPRRSVAQNAQDTVVVFGREPFTMVDFLDSALLLGVTDIGDISSMLKYLIDFHSMRPLTSQGGWSDAWVCGRPPDLE